LLPHAGPLNAQQIDFVQRIQSAVNNMNELVHNMLELAQIDLGDDPKCEEVDVCALLEKLEREFQPQAGAKGQVLRLEAPREQLRVRVDPLQLRQALSNC